MVIRHLSISSLLKTVIPATALIVAVGCGGGDDDTGGGDVDSGVDEPDAGENLLETRFGYTFDAYSVPAGEEIETCLQWTLDNEEALYVNGVEMLNEGAFHHSNWYIVPDNHFGDRSGPDGYFDCDERGWVQDTAALVGTVLFIQSTEAARERTEFPPGVVSKIPPNHMIVVDVHFLNATPRDVDTRMRIDLDLIHPSRVETVVSPFRLAYEDLDIPPESTSRHYTQCHFANDELMNPNADGEFDDLKLFYLVPHYHRLGNHVDLKTIGGSRDGDVIFELTGFNADAMGETFNPPADLSGATGLEFSCGYTNPRSESVGWGIGDQEMCVFVGFTNAEAQFQLLVGNNPGTIEETVDEDGIIWHRGGCEIIVAERPESQSPPSQAEIDGDLYIPDSGNPPGDFENFCVDTPANAETIDEPSLENISEQIFQANCSFSACHGGDSPQAELKLDAENLLDELLNHQVQASTDMPLVDPGNAENSWLYAIMSSCEPHDDDGPVAYMPRNAPRLLPDDMVAMVRDWIDGLDN